MGFIYKVTNKQNGKIYIGRTMRTIPVRWHEHLRDSGVLPTIKPSSHHISILHHAIKKYGVDCFDVCEVEECDNKLLNDRERYWIEYYQSNIHGYNIYIGGDNNTTVDDCDIIKLWEQGYIIKEIASRIGLCDDTIARRLKCIGITPKEILDRGNCVANSKKTIPVYQYDVDGYFIKEFPSVRSAQESIGGKRIKFPPALIGVSVHGYQWRKYKVDKIESVRDRTKPRIH